MTRTHVVKILLSFGALLLSGCSTTPRIQYDTVLPSQPAQSISIAISEFEDDRPAMEKGVLGAVRNAYGIQIGDVVEPPQMFVQIKEALSAELQNSGYTIASEGGDLTVSAALKTATCDTEGTRSAQIAIKFDVWEGADKVHEHIYHGAGENLTWFSIDCSKPFNEALRQVMGQFVSDLNRYEGRKGPP